MINITFFDAFVLLTSIPSEMSHTLKFVIIFKKS